MPEKQNTTPEFKQTDKTRKMFSIIVPIYNAEKLIARCVDSITAQEEKDFELILVDDGSKDSSPAICDAYSRKDKRIKTIHKENGGVSSARNKGLEEAKGDWIVFVDADDWIDKQCLSHYKEWTNQYDMVISNATKELSYNGEAEMIDYIENFAPTFLGGVCHHKAIKAELLKDKRFDRGMRFSEDSLFMANVVKNCKSVKVTTHKDYNYQEGDFIPSEKYKLKKEEIENVADNFKNTYCELSAQHRHNFDINIHLKFIVSMYPVARILDGEQTEYENLWKEEFPDLSIDDLYGNEICSPLIRSISVAKFQADHFEFRNAFKTLSKASTVFGEKFGKIDYPYPRYVKIGNLMGKGKVTGAFAYMAAMSIAKKIKGK